MIWLSVTILERNQRISGTAITLVILIPKNRLLNKDINMKSFKRTFVLAGIVALSLSGVAHATGGPGDDS